MDKDFDNYYQVDKTYSGSVNIETKFLTAKKFRELEIDFREWIIKREWKGSLLESEDGIKRNGINKLQGQRK